MASSSTRLTAEDAEDTEDTAINSAVKLLPQVFEANTKTEFSGTISG